MRGAELPSQYPRVVASNKLIGTAHVLIRFNLGLIYFDSQAFRCP